MDESMSEVDVLFGENTMGTRRCCVDLLSSDRGLDIMR